MLLAVEGGGFFSSSASGYSKGLTLLLLGQKQEDKPMRVSPWNQYQLVDQEPDPDLQLASLKNRLSHGCASFVCFGRASAGLESPSPLKVGPAQHQDVLPDPLVSGKGKDLTTELEGDDYNARKITLKSSLKKTSKSAPLPAVDANQGDALNEKGSNIPGHTERRKVQWTDVCGSELIEIREFEPRYGRILFQINMLQALHLVYCIIMLRNIDSDSCSFFIYALVHHPQIHARISTTVCYLISKSQLHKFSHRYFSLIEYEPASGSFDAFIVFQLGYLREMGIL